MTSPIRALVHTVSAFTKPEAEYTLRECIQWWKRAMQTLEGVALSSMEQKELNQRWAHLCGAVAGREGVPTGSVSYFLGELAQAELALKAVGDVEAQNTPDNG